MRRTICILTLIILTTGHAFGQSGQSSFEFLLIGPGSRASAMGEAFSAVGGDAGAPYFNPAAAALTAGTEFSLMYVSYLSDASMEHFNVLTQAKRFHFGFGFYYGKVGDFQGRDMIPTDEPITKFDEHNFALLLTGAMQASERISFGASLKTAYEKIDQSSASAFGVDLGICYKVRTKVNFATALRNLGTRPKFESVKFNLPRELRFGLAYKSDSGTEPAGIILSADYIITEWGNREGKLNLGGEYTYQRLITLRMGYGFGYDSRGFAIGGGINYRNYFFDYAFVPGRNNLSDTHRYTLRIRI